MKNKLWITLTSVAAILPTMAIVSCGDTSSSNSDNQTTNDGGSDQSKDPKAVASSVFSGSFDSGIPKINANGSKAIYYSDEALAQRTIGHFPSQVSHDFGFVIEKDTQAMKKILKAAGYTANLDSGTPNDLGKVKKDGTATNDENESVYKELEKAIDIIVGWLRMQIVNALPKTEPSGHTDNDGTIWALNTPMQTANPKMIWGGVAGPGRANEDNQINIKYYYLDISGKTGEEVLEFFRTFDSSKVQFGANNLTDVFELKSWVGWDTGLGELKIYQIDNTKPLEYTDKTRAVINAIMSEINS